MSYIQPFLYQSEVTAAEGRSAVIVLPEIFGVNSHIRGVADRFATTFAVPAFALDFFYAINGEQNDFSYDDDGMQHGVALMHQFKAEAFDTLFARAVTCIQAIMPDLQSITVIGFCMGGRLSYLAAQNPMVKTVLSLYGSRAMEPVYADGTSAVEALTEARGGDTSLRIHTFFGESDPSIPAEARAATAEALKKAGLACSQHLFAAGHAFFNDARPTYVQPAAELAWREIQDIMRS